MMVEHKKPDPLEHTLLHQLLVNSNNLQRLPGVVVLGCLVFNAVIVGAAWSWNTNRQQEALLVAASSFSA
jgi:hypothetical protein